MRKAVGGSQAASGGRRPAVPLRHDASGPKVQSVRRRAVMQHESRERPAFSRWGLAAGQAGFKRGATDMHSSAHRSERGGAQDGRRNQGTRAGVALRGLLTGCADLE